LSATPLPRDQPSTPVNDQAVCFFYGNYVLPSEDYLAFLATAQSTWKSPAVLAAVSALGLAALANIQMSPTTMMAAREEYTTALSYTNHALRDPILSKSDSTFAAVTLLGMFEVCTVQYISVSIRQRR
jgi:hypothetical protein